MMVIYKTTNLVNNKIYVGKDSKNKQNYLGGGIIINNAIQKYGRENFIKEILEICENFDQLNKREIYWIEKLDARNPDIGYNISCGGDGLHPSDASKLSKQYWASLSQEEKSNRNSKNWHNLSAEKKKAKLDKWQFKGCRTTEHKNKISEANKNKWKEPEYKEFMKAARTGCQLNKLVSDEVKNNMKKARIKNCVKVIATHKITGEIFNFDKIIDASNALNIPYHTLSYIGNHDKFENYFIKFQRDDYVFLTKHKLPTTVYIFEKDIKIEIIGKNEAKFAKENN